MSAHSNFPLIQTFKRQPSAQVTMRPTLMMTQTSRQSPRSAPLATTALWPRHTWRKTAEISSSSCLRQTRPILMGKARPTCVVRARLAHNLEVIPQEQTAVAATLSSSQLCYKGKACDVTVPEIERPQRGCLNAAPFLFWSIRGMVHASSDKPFRFHTHVVK